MRVMAGDVMVVDDTPGNLKLLEAILTAEGYRVRPFPRGRLALAAAQAKPPDIILLDVNMPDLDGYEVCSQLKADARTVDIPVLFISALNDLADKVKAFERGGVDYVSKPFQAAEVLARIAVHIKLRHLQSALEEANRQLQARNALLAEERAKTRSLLRNVLPERVISDLEQTGRTEPETFPAVTALFTDFVDFTAQSAGLEPRLLMAELNELFASFDAIVARNGCERIKTVGDAYLAVCGMASPDAQHALRIVRSAIEILDYLRERNAHARRCGGLQWRARAGIASGPVVGGVVGHQKYIYDVFGDTINTASRMEHASEPMQITVADSTRALLGDDFLFETRPGTAIKGKGSPTVYRLLDL